MKQHYDIAIIGSGPGGYRAAVLAALRNQKVAVIEMSQWGGCCLNRGCVPKKAWHNTAKILSKNTQLSQIGISGSLEPNFNNAWQHQRTTVSTIRGNYVDYMKRLGIEAIVGRAKFINDHTIEISRENGQVELLSASQFIIATGSQPFIPNNFQQKSNRILTTDTLFNTLPPEGNEVAIIGGGVIAVEFVFILKMLGKNIHWYSRTPPFKKSAFSEQAINLLLKKFEAYSLAHHLEFPVSVNEANDKIQLNFENGDPKIVDWILLATGRKPNSDQLGLNNSEISIDENGFIQTNSCLQTGAKNIYAIGDVRSPVMTANQAIADANIAIENIINKNQKTINETWVPQTIYSALEIAKVGFNENEAEDNGFEPAVGFSAFETSPAAIGQNETDGYIRIIGDMDSGDFLGGEVVGDNASELIHLLSSRFDNDNNTSLNVFSDLVVNHPSRAEEIVNATETLAQKWGLGDIIFPAK